MSVYAYHYDQDKVFDGFMDCQEDPLTPGAWLIPANCTPVEPPKAEGVMVAVYRPTDWVIRNGSCYVDGSWELVPDYRGKHFWDIKTKQEMRVLELGKEPDSNWTIFKPGPYDVWNPMKKGWELDPDQQLAAKKAELLYWNKRKFELLKDLRAAQDFDMPLVIEDLQKKIIEVDARIKSFGNLG